MHCAHQQKMKLTTKKGQVIKLDWSSKSILKAWKLIVAKSRKINHNIISDLESSVKKFTEFLKPCQKLGFGKLDECNIIGKK